MDATTNAIAATNTMPNRRPLSITVFLPGFSDWRDGWQLWAAVLMRRRMDQIEAADTLPTVLPSIPAPFGFFPDRMAEFMGESVYSS
jgi:hypothetical protein